MPHTNILLITADEMRADCTGFMGNPDIRTPHLDNLAQGGTVLDNHFAPFPKCVPSRCAMHTGRHPHTDGLRTVMPDNHLPKGDPTLGEFLREQGYETAVLGLNHVWKAEWFYGEGTNKNKKSAGVVDYHSFTEGAMADCLKQSYPFPAGKPRPLSGHPGLPETGFTGLTTGEAGNFSDQHRAEQARAYLEEIRDPAKPFFLQVNFGKPHPPYAIHEPWYSLYDPASLRPFPYALPENAPLALRAQRQWRLGEDVPEEDLREMQAVYYGMISFIDEQVGTIMAALDRAGLRDNTLVLFLSDHGDYAGQYGICEKWDGSLQDCLLHVPALVAGPGIPRGQRRGSFSEMVDLAPTILDYLDLTKPDDWTWHGESLLPVLAKDAPGKETVFASGGHEKAMRDRFVTPAWSEKNGIPMKATQGKQLTYQECPDAMARCKMVRTHEWKLVIRETGDNELYHLREDPSETRNLYPTGKYEEVIRDLQERLLIWTLQTDPDRPFLAEFGA